eukprot:COSAG02_NODE_167_length_31944_cov_19.552237_20_plen_983_part_00
MGVKQEFVPMLFTALYILLGVQVVFSYAGALYDEVFHTETGLIASCFWWVRNWCKRRQLRREIDEEDAVDVAFEAGKSAKQVSAWAFFKQHLLPGMLAGALVNIVVGAAVFKAIDRWVPDDVTDELSYSSYLWHCFITSTTVGFGDVLQGRLISHEMLVWAIVHILVSVSWLSSTAAQVADALEKRRHEEAKVNALNNELNESQIEDLGHFIVNGKLDRWGYILGKLIGQGAQLWGEDLTIGDQIEKLARHFDAFDEYGSGFLTENDLAHMMLQRKQEEKLNQVLEHAKKAEWDELVKKMFPQDETGKQASECVLPNDLINSLPMGRGRKPRQYGLLHQLIAAARMDTDADASFFSLTPLASKDRHSKKGLLVHHQLVKLGVDFDYSLKTSNGDTCMDVTQGNRHSTDKDGHPEPQVWHNDHFARFLLSEDCKSDEFRRHNEVYKHANEGNWEAVKAAIFDGGKQLLSDTLVNSLPVAESDDGRLFRRWGGLLHQLAESTTHGVRIHDHLVEAGVSFDLNLKTFDYNNPENIGKSCDQVAVESGNADFLLMVQRKRLEEACRVASKMQHGQELIDLIFDRHTDERLLPDEMIELKLVQVGSHKTPAPVLPSTRAQQEDECWGLIHYLANWSMESREKFAKPYEKHKCTGTAVHNILCKKGVKFDYGLKTDLPLPPPQTRVASRYCAPLPKTRTCVEVAQAAKNTEFTNMLLNLICDNARQRKLAELDDMLFDNDKISTIPTYLLNSLPVTRGGKSAPGLLHYLAAWADPVHWNGREWTGTTWHDDMVSKHVKFNYSLKTPPDVVTDEVPPVLRGGPKTVGEVAQEAKNHSFLAMLLNRACDCAKRMQADKLEELIFDSSYNLLIPEDLINSLPEGRGGRKRWALLHHLAAWSTTDPNNPDEPRMVNGMTVHNLVAKHVNFNYNLKNPKGQTAAEIAQADGNTEFVKMLEERSVGEAPTPTEPQASTSAGDTVEHKVGTKLNP